MTKEDKEATISALLEERRGYLVRGDDERTAQVDAQLKALGQQAAKPSAKAERRPHARTATKR